MPGGDGGVIRDCARPRCGELRRLWRLSISVASRKRSANNFGSATPAAGGTLEGMSASAVASPQRKARRAADRRRASGASARTPPPGSAGATRSRPFDLDALAARWASALGAAQGALVAASDGGHGLAPPELKQRRQALAHERLQTRRLLGSFAATAGVRPAPWLSPLPVTRAMLGVPPRTKACLFDLEGVLTDSGVLHAAAWAEVFDAFLLRRSDQLGWQFRPFDRQFDYRTYLDGRPRLEGVHAFLDSRGIHLQEGRPTDAPDAETAHGLANRKHELLTHGLREHPAAALPAARRYLEAAGQAGLKRAAVSASATATTMLEHAKLTTLLDDSIDAETIQLERLRSRPAPGVLLAACRHLGVEPSDAVTFTRTPAGIAAGHNAGLVVVGIAGGRQAELLSGLGADRVVPSLGTLLAGELLA